MKTTVSSVLKPGEEPFSEFDDKEFVEALLSPLSIVSRMTMDVYNMLYLNKAIIYLKRRIRDIYYS